MQLNKRSNVPASHVAYIIHKLYVPLLFASAAAVVWLINPLVVPSPYNCVTQYCARQESGGNGCHKLFLLLMFTSSWAAKSG